MADVADNLETAKANFAAKLAEISADPKPSYSVNGRSISWSEYYSMIVKQIEDIQRLQQKTGGPFQIKSRGTT